MKPATKAMVVLEKMRVMMPSTKSVVMHVKFFD